MAMGRRKGSAQLKRQWLRCMEAVMAKKMPRTDDTELLNFRARRGWKTSQPLTQWMGKHAQRKEGTCTRSLHKSEVTSQFCLAAPTRPGHVWVGSQAPVS